MVINSHPSDTPLRFRLTAFFTHLIISIIIALISAYVVYFIWHPAPLAKAVGVTHVFLMMLAIDATVGPLLTLVVAKPNKKSLKFDLGVIIVLQLCAYLYGMHSIAVNRPVYLAFDTKRFEVVQAADVPKSSLDKASSPYATLGYGKPKWVAVTAPENADEQSKRIFDELGEGIAPSMQPHLYEPLDEQWQQINTQAHAIAELQDFNPSVQIDAVLADNPKADAWLPLKAYNENMVVLIDKQNKKVIDIVDLRPW